MPAPPGLRIFSPLKSSSDCTDFFVRYQFSCAEIEPVAEDVRAHLGLDLLFDQCARRAVDAAADHLDRLAVENRQLREVAVGHQARHGPGARRSHVDLALDQRLGDVEVGEGLAQKIPARQH